jgi:hypothetical protein
MYVDLRRLSEVAKEQLRQAVLACGFNLGNVGAATDTYSVTFTNSIPLDKNTYMASEVIDTPTVFTPANLKIVGGMCHARLVSNGAVIPTFSKMVKHNKSGAWNGTVGAVNLVHFWFDGEQVFYSISQSDPATISSLVNTAVVTVEDPNTITVLFNIPLDPDYQPSVNAFRISNSGGDDILTSAVITTGKLVLTKTRATDPSDSIKLSYFPPNLNGLVDTNGNPILTITDMPIAYQTDEKTAYVFLFSAPGQSNDGGLSPRTNLPSKYLSTDTRVRSFDYTSNTISTYSLGTIGSDGWPINANDHGITKQLVPTYDNGFGPDVGFFYLWKQDPANAGKEVFMFKKDLTPPVSTNSSTIAYWNSTLYPRLLNEWNAFKALLIAEGFVRIKVVAAMNGLGEGDSDNGNANYVTDMEALIQRFRDDGIYNPDTKLIFNKKQPYFYAAVAAGQQTLVNNDQVNRRLVDIVNPAFLSDGVHYDQGTMLRLGMADYTAVTGYVEQLAPNYVLDGNIAGDSAAGAVLTATDPQWQNFTSKTRTWYKNGASTNETGMNYSSTVQGDVVFCRFTATNAIGTTVRDSNAMTIGQVYAANRVTFAVIKDVDWVDNGDDSYSTSYSGGDQWKTCAVADKRLPANTAGGIYQRYDASQQATSSSGILGFDKSNNGLLYNFGKPQGGFYLESTDHITWVGSSAAGYTAGNRVDGRWYGIFREPDMSIVLKYSDDEVNWTTFYSFGITDGSILYIKSNLLSKGVEPNSKLIHPRHIGLVSYS